MIEPVDLSGQAYRLDAIALINAQQRHDWDGVGRILAETTSDLTDMVLGLAQMVACAVRTQGMTVPAFLDMFVEKALDAAEIAASMPEVADDDLPF